jgi:hypothetical protein
MRYIVLVGILALAGCAQIDALHQQEDTNYCESNGFDPGTEIYLECLDMRQQHSLQASEALTQWGLRTMQGQ